jgi:hypothetical protein
VVAGVISTRDFLLIGHQTIALTIVFIKKKKEKDGKAFWLNGRQTTEGDSRRFSNEGLHRLTAL